MGFSKRPLRRGAPTGSTCGVSLLRSQLRHVLFTWLKTQGIDDAVIQPCSGRANRQSLEIHRVALADAQQAYDQTIGRFPV